MAFYPEPWKSAESEDTEFAQEMWAMEALDSPPEPERKNQVSVFRRYWETLLGR